MNPNPAPSCATDASHARGAQILQRSAQNLHIEAVRVGEQRRGELEQYVCAAFARKHGAAVRTFMPTLLAFRDQANVLRGVAGLRGAHEERLYLEQYLDSSIERALTAAARASTRQTAAPIIDASGIDRSEIVEIGNLAGASCGAAVRMVAQLPAYLIERRFQWIVFTATSALRDILASLGAPLIELAAADRDRVQDATDDWGSYYETSPRVYAGYLRDAEGLAGFVEGGRGH